MTTQFNNYSPAQYADEIGNLNAQKAEIDERMEALKDAFKTLNISAARGDHFAITVTETSSERLDIKKLTADLGKDTLAPYYITTNSKRMTIKAVARLAEVA